MTRKISAIIALSASAAIGFSTARLLPSKAITAQTESQQNIVEAIASVEEVKFNIREALTSLAPENCGNGMCQSLWRSRICQYVGALDIRTDGKIFSDASGWTESVLPISSQDVVLMRLIFDQCKPTTRLPYREGSTLMVWYNPEPVAHQAIRSALGLE